MPEIAKKKSTSTSRAQLTRRVFLGVVLILIAASLFWAGYHGLPANKTEKEKPNGNGQVEKENVSYAVYCARACFLLDKEGVILAPTARPQGSLVLAIDNEHRDPPHLGENVINAHVLAELLFLKKTLREEYNVHLGKATQSRLVPEDFDFETHEGWHVRVSTANNAYATIEVLMRTLTKLGAQASALEYIDLRIENRVYYKTL